MKTMTESYPNRIPLKASTITEPSVHLMPDTRLSVDEGKMNLPLEAYN